ncbi:hypothetical protein Tco_1356307 [Tanacetum coccineum]
MFEVPVSEEPDVGRTSKPIMEEVIVEDYVSSEEDAEYNNEVKDRVYLHSIESRRNLKLYKNDNVRVRARYDGKVLVFTMSQDTRPTGANQGMEAGPSGSSGLKYQ